MLAKPTIRQLLFNNVLSALSRALKLLIMKKTQKRIDQLKNLSVSVIEKDQQRKVKGGIHKRKIPRPSNG